MLITPGSESNSNCIIRKVTNIFSMAQLFELSCSKKIMSMIERFHSRDQRPYLCNETK